MREDVIGIASIVNKMKTVIDEDELRDELLEEMSQYGIYKQKQNKKIEDLILMRENE